MNHLVKALCDNREEKHMQKIPHVKDSLVDHIGELLQERDELKFKFVALEHNHNLKS